MVFTGAGVATMATAAPAHAGNPYAELNEYCDSMMKAKEKRYGYCWKHIKKYEDNFVHCKLGKKYQDYEVTDLTGPHYDSDAGVAAPGPALRDIEITVPSKFGKTEARVVSEYNMDKDADGVQESHDLVRSEYTLRGGDTIVVRVPVAAFDPKCGGHNIHVTMTETRTGKYAQKSVIEINTPDGVDLDNPPAIERIA